jgi:hypothetical protein
MLWGIANRADSEALELADRHYNRQKVGTPQFVPPGRCVVLKTACRRAVWVTSSQRFVLHAWPGAWVNTLFRNEGAGLSSLLILEALAVTRHLWREVPAAGVVTFVDPRAVRAKRDPGRCYLRAGFQDAGTTAGGLIALHLPPDRIPPPAEPLLLM